MRKIVIFFSFIILYKTNILSAQVKGSAALPHVLVYKAKAKYKNLVPVQLSQDKKSVVSYPGPSDIKTGSNGSTLLPVSLHNGYWLDKIGVGLNTAYIKLTYREYSKLPAPPSPMELYNMIVDKSPITELCDCGLRSAGVNSVKQLNEWIDKKMLEKKCKKVK